MAKLQNVTTSDLMVYLNLAKNNFEFWNEVAEDDHVSKGDKDHANKRIEHCESIIENIDEELQNRLDKIFDRPKEI